MSDKFSDDFRNIINLFLLLTGVFEIIERWLVGDGGIRYIYMAYGATSLLTRYLDRNGF